MARDFNGSSDFLENGAAVLSAYPCTLACWFNTDSNTTVETMMSLAISGGTGFVRLFLHGAAAGDPVGAQSQSGGGASGFAVTSTGFSTGTWHHGAGVFSASNSRVAYIDGGNSGSETTSVTFPAVNRTEIGVNINGAFPEHMDGRIAEAAIWDAALTADEIATLAKAISPKLVRPESLIAYWPLWGTYTTEPDLFGAAGLTVTGATAAVHPRSIGWVRGNRIVPAAAAGGELLPKMIQCGLYASSRAA